MAASLPLGALNVSIDLGDLGLSAGATRTAAALVNLLDEQVIPATWAFREPATSDLAAMIAARSTDHEIALSVERGADDWHLSSAARRELARRVDAARARGWTIATLVGHTATLGGLVETAARLGMRAICHSHASPRIAAPRPARYGLCSFSVSLSLPGTQRWLNGLADLRAARRGLERAVAERSIFHVAIDVERLVAKGRAGVDPIARFLQLADLRRRTGTLLVSTLSETAEHLARRYSPTPSRSILRAAA